MDGWIADILISAAGWGYAGNFPGGTDVVEVLCPTVQPPVCAGHHRGEAVLGRVGLIGGNALSTKHAFQNKLLQGAHIIGESSLGKESHENKPDHGRYVS